MNQLKASRVRESGDKLSGLLDGEVHSQLRETKLADWWNCSLAMFAVSLFCE